MEVSQGPGKATRKNGVIPFHRQEAEAPKDDRIFRAGIRTQSNLQLGTRGCPFPAPRDLNAARAGPLPPPTIVPLGAARGLPGGPRWAGPGSRARSAPGAAGGTPAIRPCAAGAASVHGQSSGVIRLSLPPAEPIHILITARPARERPLSRGGGSPPPTCRPPAPAPSSRTFICTGEGSLGKPRPQLGLLGASHQLRCGLWGTERLAEGGAGGHGKREGPGRRQTDIQGYGKRRGGWGGGPRDPEGRGPRERQRDTQPKEKRRPRQRGTETWRHP